MERPMFTDEDMQVFSEAMQKTPGVFLRRHPGEDTRISYALSQVSIHRNRPSCGFQVSEGIKTQLFILRHDFSVQELDAILAFGMDETADHTVASAEACLGAALVRRLAQYVPAYLVRRNNFPFD